jgi:glycosyltransferase involved in cell wall biosynthesis
MATGLPIVATTVEGIGELLPPDTGQTAEFGDEDTFVQHISTFLGNDRLRREVGERNRIRVAQGFSLHAMIQAYQDLYISLIHP